MLDWSYFGNTLRSWLIALAILAGVTIALTVLRQVIWRRLRHAVHDHVANGRDRVAADFVHRTSVLAFVALGVVIASIGLTLPARIELLVRDFTVVVLLLQFGLWGNGLVRAGLDRYVARHASADGNGGIATSRTTVAALGVLIRAVMWILLILVALDSLGVRVTTLITGLGVTGIALALAVQNILGDLFAALSIVVDKPFIDGDAISVDTFSGTVEHIGLKTTRVRSTTGEQIVFSNADLLKSRIRNFRRLRERTSTLSITLDQTSPPEAIGRVPAAIREIVEAQSQTRLDRSHVTPPNANGIGVETVFTVLSPDYRRFMDVQQAITLGLLNRLPALGVKLASTGGVTVVTAEDRERRGDRTDVKTEKT